MPPQIKTFTFQNIHIWDFNIRAEPVFWADFIVTIRNAGDFFWEAFDERKKKVSRQEQNEPSTCRIWEQFKP